MKCRLHIASVIIFLYILIPINSYGQTDKILDGPSSGEVTSSYSLTMVPGFETIGDFEAFIVSFDPDPPYSPPNFTSTDGSDMNYIYTRSLRQPYKCKDCEVQSLDLDTFKTSYIAEQVQYYDGLGRLIQDVQIKASPNLGDVITPVDYDDFGRENIKYLAYIDSFSGKYRQEAINKQELFFSGINILGRTPDSRPFTEIAYECSPLNRVLSERDPGEEWTDDNAVRYNYYTNNAGKVIKWKVEYDRCIYDGYYGAAELYKNVITNENGHVSVEYKDKAGQVILKQNEYSTKTYYVYDDFNLLRFVLPPKAVKAIKATTPDNKIIRYLCYSYQYDERKRMIWKKLPGAGSVHMEYDNLDRLIFTQDSVQRTKANKEKHFTTYDKFSRPIRTGIQYESGATDTLTWTYYDGYDFNGDGNADYNYIENDEIKQTSTRKVIGQVTGTKTRILGTDKYLISATFYDEYYRVVQVQQENQFGEYDVTTNQYEFWGGIKKSVMEHYLNASKKLKVVKTYDYDHTGRLIAVHEQVNDQDIVTVSRMGYNQLGELTEKHLHVKEDKAAQKIDYEYNIRGWLRGINRDKSENDLFSMELYYIEAMDEGLDYTQEKQYNGNISGMSWEMSGDESLFPMHSYTFKYDNLNRLKHAYYEAGNKEGLYPLEFRDRFNEGGIKYDENGNIEKLVRNGGYDIAGDIHYGPIDTLMYVYKEEGKSNQLACVDDKVNIEGYGYNDKGKEEPDFLYDGNGNLIKHQDKSIDTIYYNYLNLPQKIVFENNDSIVYLYDAGGVKHMKAYYSVQNQNNTEHYIGGIIYQIDTTGQVPQMKDLKYMMNEEGRISQRSAGKFVHEYFIKDHLGNTRVLFGDYNQNDTIEQQEVLQQAHYYPFGMAFTGYDLSSDTNKFLYNGKELQTDAGLDWYDYGARFYDPSLGRWHVIDAMAESYYSWTPYKYAMCNPIMFIDPNGLWDVTVHAYNDREQYGYGVAIVTDRHGNEVARYDVRVNGQHHDRMAENGDTPTGVYDIPDENMWMSGGSVASYGPNHRLILNTESGEAEESGRSLFRMHGGRQGEDDWKQEPNEPLQKTNGCVRMYDDDIADMKTITDGLMENDPEEIGGQVEVLNDLEMNGVEGNSVEVQYNVPEEELDYWQNLVNSFLNGE